jgi:translocation protein SEC62
MTEDEAINLLADVLKSQFIAPVNRGGPTGGSDSPKLLQYVTGPEQTQMIADGYYAWLYEGSQWPTYAGVLLMVVFMLGVMFPLWPPTMRLGV